MCAELAELVKFDVRFDCPAHLQSRRPMAQSDATGALGLGSRPRLPPSSAPSKSPEESTWGTIRMGSGGLEPNRSAQQAAVRTSRKKLEYISTVSPPLSSPSSFSPAPCTSTKATRVARNR